MSKDKELSKGYLSAAGWDPDETFRKMREKHSDDYSLPTSAMDVSEARETVEAQELSHRPDLLFGELWRSGEVALMFGEPCVGKSVLAVQIAEAIALGCSPEPFTVTSPASVLYIDMEFTARQFAERYSFADFGGTIKTYKFPAGFHRAELRGLDEMSEREGRNVAKYIAGQIRNLIADHQSSVVIIDNLSYLTPSAGSGQAGAQLIKTLKLMAKLNDISILALTHLKTRPPTDRFRHSQITEGQRLLDLADSAFMLGNSTMGDEIRYLRQLKSRSGKLRFDGNIVAALQLTRMENSPAAVFKQAIIDYLAKDAESRPKFGERPSPKLLHVELFSPDNEPLGIVTSSNDPTPRYVAADRRENSDGSFVGLHFLGDSTEQSHVTDYQRLADLREYRRRSLANRPRHQTSAAKTAEMLLTPEHRHYLKP